MKVTDEQRIYLIGCALTGFLSRSSDPFELQAADSIQQADEVIRLLEESGDSEDQPTSP